MEAREFIQKWGQRGTAYGLNERAGAQAHFIDLCRLLEVPEPADPANYCFERSFVRSRSERGFADVWMRGCFAWEYKAPDKNLKDALDQLMRYTLSLENPPLLVVSDRQRYEIHTHFTGYPSKCIPIEHEDIIQPETQALLRAIFTDPYQFKPRHSSVEITKAAAEGFAAIAERMQARGVDSQQAAHFLTQCLFSLFAEQVGLLKTTVFKALADKKDGAESFRVRLSRLFEVMRTGGDFGVADIPWFNGGLFEKTEVPDLLDDDVQALRSAAALDWRGLDPTIFGTLFERGLNPSKRSQLGAHYTDPATIEKLVKPVIERPLLAEWEHVKAQIYGLLELRDELREGAQGIASKTKPLLKKFARVRTRANVTQRKAQDLFNEYLQRLRDFRVLDPACGSGNFLYVALRALKDIEHKANFEAEELGLQRQFPGTGPQNVLGLELNAYAAELSRVTIWIGELQWRMQHGFGWKTNPILDPLDQIECRDALIDTDGSEAKWPQAHVVVGNPPFIGNKKMRAELGTEYVETLRSVYADTVPGGVDLVCYWFDKALKELTSNRLDAAGLVATQAIRKGTSRSVLDAIVRDSRIFDAWADEPWVNEGAAVRVAMVCFGGCDVDVRLNDLPVPRITSDLNGSVEFDLTTANPLTENAGVAFQGPVKVGAFDITGERARQWLSAPNPHGRSNAEVLKPWANGQDTAKRSSDNWIIDFGTMTQSEAALFAQPFAHVRQVVKPQREAQKDESRRRFWWRHGRTGDDYRKAIATLKRYIATPRVAKHRFFVWLPVQVWPDSRLYAIARDDDWTFGVLSSRIHEVWSLANASMHGVGNDPTYNAKSCFETFPFPTNRPKDARTIELHARELNDLRERWLNPPEWTERVPDVMPLGMLKSSYPDRIVCKAGFQVELKDRTMTKLYNERPAWLAHAHETLDAAVAKAYGWSDYASSMTDNEILRRLMKLNGEGGESNWPPAPVTT